MRAISTLVDTVVFLLLLGGAVTTLVVGTVGMQPATDDRADETAEMVATTTQTVEYGLTPSDGSRNGISYDHLDNATLERSAHGTTAGLLGAAALSATTLDGERVTPASRGFEQVVRNETRGVISQRETATAVTATWEPYTDAPVAGTVHVGPEPSRNVDVHAARLTVDSGVDPARERALDAALNDGFDGVARIVASTVVAGLFPPKATRVGLHGDAPVDTLTAHRYRRVARLTNAPVLDIDKSSVERMNERLASALADRLRRDLRQRFQSPEAAARAVSTGDVQIVVRTWSP